MVVSDADAPSRARRVREGLRQAHATSRSSATQNRGGKGIILIDASERNGPVVGIKLVKDGDEVMLITDRGQTLRTRVDEIRETGRNAQGVKIMTIGRRGAHRRARARSPRARVEADGGGEQHAASRRATAAATASRRGDLN